MVYEDEGKLNEANRVLELGIHMSPKNIKMRFAQVLFYQRIGKTEKAYQDALVLLEDIKELKKHQILKYNKSLMNLKSL